MLDLKVRLNGPPRFFPGVLLENRQHLDFLRSADVLDGAIAHERGFASLDLELLERLTENLPARFSETHLRAGMV